MEQRVPQPGLDKLLVLAAEGDPQAWRGLVDAYFRRVYALLVKQCGDRELSEEITQATFVKVVAHIGQYKEQGKFESWLFLIAMNKLRDEVRRRKRQAVAMDMSEGRGEDEARVQFEDPGSGGLRGRGGEGIVSPLDAMTKAEQLEQLREAVSELSEKDREIVYLRHTAGLSFPQIAETLGQPLGTVLARGHRALAKLRKLLHDRESASEASNQESNEDEEQEKES